jgi:hypothetical protein
MIDLEERIAETLQDRAPVFVRQMPKGTVARVRIRQSIGSFATLALVAALAVGAVALSSRVPRSVQPASRQTVQAPSGVLPSPQGVEGGVNDATAAPASDPSATEDTSAHDTNSTVPYTEQVKGQEVYLLTQKHVVSFGHVSGVEWSLAAYDTKPYSGDQFPRFLGGSCGDLMVGDQGEYGGIGFCLHTGETAPDAAFAMAGFGNASDQERRAHHRVRGPRWQSGFFGGAEAVGWRDEAAAALRRSLGDRRAVLRGVRRGGDRRPHRGARDPTGRSSVQGSLCISQPPSGPDNVGCGHGLEGVSSVVTSFRGTAGINAVIPARPAHPRSTPRPAPKIGSPSRDHVDADPRADGTSDGPHWPRQRRPVDA